PTYGTGTHLVGRDVYLNLHPHTIYGLGHWRRYCGGIYVSIPELQVRQELQAALGGIGGFDVTTPAINSVLGLVRDHVFVHDSKFDADSEAIIFDNCILSLKDFGTRPHSPLAYWTSKLEFNYDPSARSDAWARWTNRIDHEVLNFLQEFGGYSVTSETLHEIALWLYGPPGGGKSTYIEGLKSAVGSA